jgi:hypothetical protein
MIRYGVIFLQYFPQKNSTDLCGLACSRKKELWQWMRVAAKDVTLSNPRDEAGRDLIMPFQ